MASAHAASREGRGVLGAFPCGRRSQSEQSARVLALGRRRRSRTRDSRIADVDARGQQEKEEHSQRGAAAGAAFLVLFAALSERPRGPPKAGLPGRPCSKCCLGV